VDVLDEKVGRREEQALGARLEDGAVIADADLNPGRAPDRSADDLDQAAFGWSPCVRSADAVSAGAS